MRRIDLVALKSETSGMDRSTRTMSKLGAAPPLIAEECLSESCNCILAAVHGRRICTGYSTFIDKHLQHPKVDDFVVDK